MNFARHLILALLASSSAAASIINVIAGEPNLQFFDNALVAAGLVGYFNGTGPYTLFAPNNTAFLRANSTGLIGKLLKPEWKAHLQYLLKFHATAGSVLSTSLKNNTLITTLGHQLTETVVATVRGDDITLSSLGFNNSKIVEADLTGSNGVVHVVDKVFIPRFLTLNFWDAIQSIDAGDQIGRLLAMVVAAGFEETLKQESITIFTPSDIAFNSLSQDVILELENDVDLTERILKNHVIEKVWSKEALTDGLKLLTMAGETLVMKVGTGRFAEYYVDDAYIEVADIVTKNGIAHMIDAMLLPPDVAASIKAGSP